MFRNRVISFFAISQVSSFGIALFLIGAILKPGFCFAAQTNVYTETSYSREQENTIHSGRIHLTPLFEIEGLYIGALVSTDTKSTDDEVYNEKSTALTLGYERLLPIPTMTAGVEVRSVANQFRDDSKEPIDFRLGLYHYNRAAFSKYFSIESYGESVYSSRIYEDVFATIWLRPRYLLHRYRQFDFDFYSEGFIKRDRLGFFYENLQEFRWGALASLKWNPAYFQLQLYRAHGQYTDREYRDPNPNKKEYSDNRALFVFGGTW
ncbi:MAG: hypothetical protein KDD25_03680 [Bdellovibrionales bacterium]|nr:hypothetical protein [Bdellovibrionales bacterium]